MLGKAFNSAEHWRYGRSIRAAKANNEARTIVGKITSAKPIEKKKKADESVKDIDFEKEVKELQSVL